MLYLCTMFATRHLLSCFVPAFVLLLTACSPRALREAQELVAEADSLRTEGVAFTDSMALAEAYNTLEKWQYIYPTDYAHACYHYGRLLRNNDDPAAAMQVFINGSHSHTRDYHILGRTYSNMGSICQLANEHPLSYEMYALSADMFLKDSDSLRYNYALNEMAVALAVQGEKESTLSLITQIQQQCTDSGTLLRTLETLAEMYRVIEMSDSAIFWINEASRYGDIGPYGIIIKAQSFDNLCIKDSAILYAQMIISNTTAPYHARFNALYIISHNDSTLSKDSALTIASAREDIRYYEYEPENEKLTIAIELLKRDLARKPVWPWLVLIICLLLTGGSIAGFSIYKKKTKRQLLSQQIEDLQIAKAATMSEKKQTLEEQCKLFASSSNLVVDLCWKDYESMCNVINKHFWMLALKLRQANLTEKEVRLCVLVLLNLSRIQMAGMLFYSPNGMGKFKYRVSQKLSTEGKNLRKYLIDLAIDNSLNDK